MVATNDAYLRGTRPIFGHSVSRCAHCGLIIINETVGIIWLLTFDNTVGLGNITK